MTTSKRDNRLSLIRTKVQEQIWITPVVFTIAGLILGAALGIAIGIKPLAKTSSDYKILKADYDTAQADLETASLDASEMHAREDKLELDELDVESYRAQLDQRSGELDDRESDLGMAEKKKAKRTISGAGTYEVGEDMKAGTYKSKGGDGRDCYWAILRDSSPGNIVTNNLSGGPAVATVRNGQFFMTEGCQDWTRQ